MIGFWGFNSAKEISALKDDAEKKYKTISQITEDVYYSQAKGLERDISDLLKELPGLEFTGAKADSVRGDVERAYKSIELLEASIPAEKRVKTKFLAIGFLCMIKKDYDSAIISLNQYDKEIPEKYLLLGQAYRKLRKFDRSEDVLTKVYTLSQNCKANTILAKSYNTKANLASDKGNNAEALSLYQKALQYDPGLYAVHYNSAAVCSLLGRNDQVVRHLCNFARYHDGDVIVEIETDPDHDFDKFKAYLGPNWKTKLKAQLTSCLSK